MDEGGHLLKGVPLVATPPERALEFDGHIGCEGRVPVDATGYAIEGVLPLPGLTPGVG